MGTMVYNTSHNSTIVEKIKKQTYNFAASIIHINEICTFTKTLCQIKSLVLVYKQTAFLVQCISTSVYRVVYFGDRCLGKL